MDASVTVDETVRDGMCAIAGRTAPELHGRQHRRPIVGVNPIEVCRQGGRFFSADVEDLSQRGRPVELIGLVIVLEDAQVGDSHGSMQPLLALAQGFLRFFPFRDVDRHHGHIDRPSLLVIDQKDIAQDRDGGPRHKMPEP